MYSVTEPLGLTLGSQCTLEQIVQIVLLVLSVSRMSNSPCTSSPDTCIEAAIQEIGLEKSMRTPESESKEGVDSSFDALMDKLVCKIQGEDSTVGHYAAEIEATVLNILHQYPDQMDEDTVVDVKRDIFYNGLRKVYRESFIHISHGFFLD